MTATDHMLKVFKNNLHHRGHPQMRDQFLKEGLMRSELSLAARRSLGRWFRMAHRPHLVRPTRARRGRQLQTQRCRAPA